MFIRRLKDYLFSTLSYIKSLPGITVDIHISRCSMAQCCVFILLKHRVLPELFGHFWKSDGRVHILRLLYLRILISLLWGGIAKEVYVLLVEELTISSTVQSFFFKFCSKLNDTLELKIIGIKFDQSCPHMLPRKTIIQM